jgi:hypothetical protein
MKWKHKTVLLPQLDAELEAMTGMYIHSVQFLPGDAQHEDRVFIAAYLMDKSKFKKSWGKKKASSE